MSKQTRDEALSKIEKDGIALQDSKGRILKIRPAKTERQRNRNANVFKARDLLIKDPKSNQKKTEIDWKSSRGKGWRIVEIGGQIAFEQNQDEVTGRFLEPYHHLNLI